MVVIEEWKVIRTMTKAEVRAEIDRLAKLKSEDVRQRHLIKQPQSVGV